MERLNSAADTSAARRRASYSCGSARQEIGIGNHIIAGLEKQAGLNILWFSRCDCQRFGERPIKEGGGDAALII